MNLAVGNTYKVAHSRKGRFILRVTAVSGEFVTGVIVSGVAVAMLEYNARSSGEEITIRLTHCVFEQVAP